MYLPAIKHPRNMWQTVVNLVGTERVKCCVHVLNGISFGTQVHRWRIWLGEYLPSLKPRNIEELLGEEAGLN